MNPRATARLEHRSAGRVRARVSREHRSPEHMEQMSGQLRSHPAVARVEVNHRTGSVLVSGADELGLRVALDECLDVVEEGGAEGVPEAGVESAVILVQTADRWVAHATGHRLRLRLLVPAAFVAAGVRQLLAEGLTLGAVPWYVLLYYGVDSFLKLHPEHAPRVPARPDR